MSISSSVTIFVKFAVAALECCKFICKHLMSVRVVSVVIFVFLIPISVVCITFVFFQNSL